MTRGYRALPFGTNRRLVAASVAVGRERNTIHMLTEADITEARRLLRAHRERTGERLSLTAHVVSCLVQAVAEYPSLNAFRRGRKLILLDELTVSVLLERALDGEDVPEPLGIRNADRKAYRDIHDEIRRAQRTRAGRLGELSGTTWPVRFLPSALFRLFVRLASRSIEMQRRYGRVAVTAVGMFGNGPLWLLPISSATVTVAVGGVVPRPVVIEGRMEEREHLCLTLSFDHDLVDGAPAARFTARFAEILAAAEALGGYVGDGA